MHSRFTQQCLEMLHVASVKEFTKRLIDCTQSFGFETVAAMVITDHSPTLIEFQSVTNAPTAYLDDFQNLELGRIDPVSQHCKRSSSPIVWDRRTYSSTREQQLWAHQAEFGLRSGIAVAMHPGRGRHFMFGADWSRDRCERVPHFRRIAEDLLEFAAHAQAAAFELSQPYRPPPEEGDALRPHELEVLRWSMDGRTSWEIGMEMSITERHATLLLQRAMRKLGCGTKYEAALRAIRLGLICAP